MRKLAHIEKITDIQPIKDADRIELAKILGWQVVVRKEQFVVGDIVIYVEVDSILPDKPEYEFLRKYKYRIKTQKLRKVLSQGLIIALEDVVDLPRGKYEIGKDVTKLLEITKYLPPSELRDQREKQLERNRLAKFMMRYSWFRRFFLSRTKKVKFPYWASKTDEERIQNMPEVLEKFAGYNCHATEKIDYQSATFTSKEVPKFTNWIGRFIPAKKVIFVVASRNLQVMDKNTLYWKMAEKYNLEIICKKYPGIIIQGEQGGPGVQGNKYKLTEHKLFVFNVRKDGKLLDPAQMKMFCNENSLETVPYLGHMRLSRFPSVEAILEFANGKSTLNSNVLREGIVIRYIRDGQKILSFKVVSNKFLLKHD